MGDSNPADELCAKLDELGVEWETGEDSHGNEEIWWRSPVFDAWVYVTLGEELGTVHLEQPMDITPEQAIAATVGVDSDTGEAIRKLLDKLNTELCNAGCVIDCETREERKRLIDAVKDKYAQAIAAMMGKDIERYDGSGRRGTVAILQGSRKPEEVLFVREDGVTHYLPEDVGTCRNLSSGGEFTCSECGYNVVEGCEGDFDGFRHCPSCGRRIKEESE